MAKPKFMDVEEIISYLELLGDELDRRGFVRPVRVLIFGGVSMLLQVQNRTTTEDIDALLLDLPAMTNTDAPKETLLIKAAVLAISKKQKISQKWFNDDGAMFVRGFTPQPEMYHWCTFNKLEVYLPSNRMVLIHKLMSYREKDIRDILQLLEVTDIRFRHQAQDLLNDWVAGRWQREYMVERALDELFDE